MLLAKNKLLLLSCFFLVGYVIVKAALMDITHDEAFSFYNMKNFWYVQVLCTGNTHWLNSMCIKLFLLLKQESLWQIRFLSILSFLIYSYIGIKWILKLNSTITPLLAFSLFFLHPYLLDYFSLARGYASGIAFECLGGYYFILSLKSNSRTEKLACLIFSGLSVVSNFGFIYFFIAIHCIYFFKFYLLSKEKIRFKALVTDIFISSCFLLFSVLCFTYIIKCSNDIVGAGIETFPALFYSFIDGFSYFKFHFSKSTLDVLSWALSALLFLSIAHGIIRNKIHQNQIYFYCSLCLVFIFSMLLVNRMVFDLVYPYYRTSLFLFPLVALNFTYSFHYILPKSTSKIIFGICVSGGMILNFIFSANLKFCFDFKEQADCTETFNFVGNLNPKNVGISPEIYGAFRNYYHLSNRFEKKYAAEKIETLTPNGVLDIKNKLKEFDYLIIYPPYDLSYYSKSQVKFSGIYLSSITKNLVVRVE